jgi:hypothetical protein
MAQTVLTAPDQFAMELMDQRMDTLVPHATEKSQPLSHITIPIHLPEDHTKQLVTNQEPPSTVVPLTKDMDFNPSYKVTQMQKKSQKLSFLTTLDTQHQRK